MGKSPEIWFNGRCSKCRQALETLEARNLAPTVVRYLEDTPSEARLREVIGLLGGRAIDLVRTTEAVFGELGLSRDSSDDALVAAMVAHPVLIQRPVVIHQGKAVIARPVDRLEDVL
ncbi:MAG: arsenate reductase (glutaredoxin) [Myxococcales bacterium]|nr:arsenate reductase (glutaredoxin) [Myxococcales bacterium]